MNVNIEKIVDNIEVTCLGIVEDLRKCANIAEGRRLADEIVRWVDESDMKAEAVILEYKHPRDYIDIEIGRKGTRGVFAFYGDNFYCKARIFLNPYLYLEYSKPQYCRERLIEVFNGVFKKEGEQCMG